ncbi:LysR family transcriptional regulator [Bifidobacterium aquikefiri]|uniref:LysR family transcriptional regulator n=1 Tax=Bifidobacterium aquikefiri TaxID=1653207 RepID=UPI0039ECA71E
MTIRQLRAIAMVADCGNFSEAAARLGTSQPNISEAVTAFEQYAGCLLFTRHPVELTSVGKMLLIDIKRILDGVEELEACMLSLRSAPQYFSVALPTTLNLAYGNSIRAQWKCQMPGCRMEILEGEDEEIQSWLESGSVDAGVLINPAHSRFHGEPHGQRNELWTDTYRGVIRTDHPFARNSSITVTDFIDDRIGLSNSGCRKEIETLCRNAEPGFVPNMMVSDIQSLLNLVKYGKIVTILPSTCESILPEGVIMLPLTPTISRHLVLVSCHNPDDSKLSLFKEFAQLCTVIRED